MRIGEIFVAEELLTEPSRQPNRPNTIWARLDLNTDNQGREGWVKWVDYDTPTGRKEVILEKQSRKWTKAIAALALQNMYRRRDASRRIKLLKLTHAIWPEGWTKILRERPNYTSATLQVQFCESPAFVRVARSLSFEYFITEAIPNHVSVLM